MSNQTNNSSAGTTTTKVFSVPSISCKHCVRSVQNEVSEVAGVTSVQADENTKVVTVVWQSPATWEQIKAVLTEINYPPQELIQL
jgi:copper chaperone CopZ